MRRETSHLHGPLRFTPLTGLACSLASLIAITPVRAAVVPAMAARSLWCATPPPTAPARATTPPPAPSGDTSVDAARARLDQLRRDARDPSLDLDARRRAVDALLEAESDFITAHADDLRVGRWLADAAEDCFITALPMGGELDSVLFGFPSHAEWRRTSALVVTMLDLAERAEGATRSAVALLSDPARSIDASQMVLLDAYEVVEIPRRLPLLRGIAETLSAAIVERDPALRRERASAAWVRLAPLLDELEDEALLHASLAAMLASGIARDSAHFDRAITAARLAAREDAGSKRRVEWTAALARSEMGDSAAAVARAHAQFDALLTVDRSAGDASDIESALRRSAMLAARLRRVADTHGVALDGRHWSDPLRAWPARVPTARRSVQRSAALARLADLAESEIDTMHGAPLADLAAGEALARTAGNEQASLARIDAALAMLEPDEPWRAAALEASARVLVRLNRHADAVDRLLERAGTFRVEPESAVAADQAVALARVLDDGDPASAHRARLQHALELAAGGFPDHPSRSRWRAERIVLLAEAIAAAKEIEPGTRDELATALASARPAIMALHDDELGVTLAARLALARATIALASLDGDAALAALDAAPSLDRVPLHADALRERRVLALALVDRDLATDPMLASMPSASHARFDAALLQALQRIAPALEPGAPVGSDPRRRAAVLRLAAMVPEAPAPSRASDTGVHSSTTPAAHAGTQLQTATADALRAVGLPAAALPRYRALRAIELDRVDLLLGEAECLFALPSEAAHERERLAQAIVIYQRLLGRLIYTENAAERTALWWLCHLRQLECLQRSGTDTDPIAARVERLRVLDPNLGGPAFAPQFEALAKRAR